MRKFHRKGLTIIIILLLFVAMLTIALKIIHVSGSPEEWSEPTQLTFNDRWDGTTSVSRDGSKISFSSYIDGDYELFVVNSDGTGLTQLTSNTAEEWCTSISSDGSKLAFWSDFDGDFEIFVINSDGTGLTQLTSNNATDTYASISGDGSKLAFKSDVSGYDELFVINSDGTGLTQLTFNNATVNHPFIYVDGSKIAFECDVDGDFEIFVINSDGTGLTQLTFNSLWDGYPTVSDDGSKIAFVYPQYTTDDEEIFVINSDGTGLTQLTSNTADDRWPRMSGDGSKIAFWSAVDGDSEIFTIKTDGTGLSQLTNNTVNDDWHSINGDGSKVAFSSDIDGDKEIFVTNVQNQLTIDVDGSGSTFPAVGTHSYVEGTQVPVTATASSGWSFDHWILDSANVGSTNPYTVTMDADHTLIAVFREIPVEYELRISMSGSGSTSPAVGSHTYGVGAEVTVTASPEQGWQLDHWILDGVDIGKTNPLSIVMNDSHVLSAIYKFINPPSISVLDWTPENPLENEAVDVQFSISEGTEGIVSVVFCYRVSEGQWEEVSADYNGEVWTATIPGNKAGDVVDFFIECHDNLGNRAISEVFSYPVKEPAQTLDILIISTVAGTGATLGGIGAYRLIYQKSLSSEKIRTKAKQKNKTEVEKEKKDNKRRKKKSREDKPNLDIKINVPPKMIAGRSYKAELVITNKGLASAKKIEVKATSTPGLTLNKEIAEIDELKPNKKGKKSLFVTFPFKANEQIKKGIYKIRFEVKGKNVKSRTFSRYIHGLKIGILIPKKPQQIDSLKNWLKKQGYTCDEISQAKEFLKLLRYDLLILPSGVELEKKETQNITKFVGNGQSLLVIDRIFTYDQKGLSNILGYNETRFEGFKSKRGVLKITNNQSLITKGFAMEEKILMGKYWGNASISSASGEIIAVQTIKTDNAGMITIPAIMVNQFEKGKTLHLNFHAEETISQIMGILDNAIDWLLS